MRTEPIAWQPTPEMIADANLTRFIAACGRHDYDDLLAWSVAEPEAFYRQLLAHIDYRFIEPFSPGDGHLAPASSARAGASAGAPTSCSTASTNGRARRPPTKSALEWIGENGDRRSLTYAELDAEVCRLAAGLRRLGLGPGDVVAIYLPNIPEAVVSLLAVPKIGGIVLPLFSGFGADAVVTRLNDAKAKAVITVDGSYRRGRVVAAKQVIDEARARVPSLAHVIVCHRVDAPMQWTRRRRPSLARCHRRRARRPRDVRRSRPTARSCWSTRPARPASPRASCTRTADFPSRRCSISASAWTSRPPTASCGCRTWAGWSARSWSTARR